MTGRILRDAFRLFLAVLALDAAAPALAAGVEERHGKVTHDEEHILTYFFNCKGKLAPTTAVAEKGYIRVEPSTRKICDHDFQPVQQVIYMSPKNYTGGDVVKYYINNKLVGFITLDVGSERTLRLNVKNVRTMAMSAGEERAVYASWDCKSADPKPPFISKSKGLISFRDSTGAACGSSSYPIRKIFYRAAPGFVGEDEVVIAGPFGPPMTTKFTITKPDAVETANNAAGSAPQAGTASSAVPDASAAAAPGEDSGPQPPEVVTELAKLDEDHDRERSIWDDDKEMTRYFSRDFMSDWRKAHQKGGEVLDRDPLTLSQNTQGMHILNIASKEIEGESARVTVLYEEHSADDGKVYLPARSALFKLKRENGGWRIDEVQAYGVKTVRDDGKTDPEAAAMAEGLHVYLKYYQAHPHAS